MARIKLARFGIDHRFQFGFFGEEAADRNALARLAVTRLQTRYAVPPSRCIVIGDTPLDVECARAAGAWVVAVATGQLGRSHLEALAPDLVLDDLADTAAFMAWVRTIAAQD
jgi:phosphoglycolate phosphatase-like HAD superfamily hydrolase